MNLVRTVNSASTLQLVCHCADTGQNLHDECASYHGLPLVGMPRCDVPFRIERTGRMHQKPSVFIALLNAARSSQRDDPAGRIQTVPLPGNPETCQRSDTSGGISGPITDAKVEAVVSKT